MGEVEGFVEEMMNGQKVVKVFCHEKDSIAAFDRVNDELFHNAEQANTYANTLGPILNNIGNVLYVLVALAGGILLLTGAPNLALSGMAFSISIAVPFLNMTKQFAGGKMPKSMRRLMGKKGGKGMLGGKMPGLPF